jgi:hypothetical protein
MSGATRKPALERFVRARANLPYGGRHDLFLSPPAQLLQLYQDELAKGFSFLGFAETFDGGMDDGKPICDFSSRRKRDDGRKTR